MPSYKYVACLSTNSLLKSSNILYCLNNINVPAGEDLLKFVEDQYAKDPNSFSIDVVEKLSFDNDSLQKIDKTLQNEELIAANDIYYRYVYSTQLASKVLIKRIRPCTPLHIKKHMKAVFERVVETKFDYLQKVLPYIESIPPSRIAWVQKILDGQAETEHVLLHDKDPESGFVLLPDSKWDQKDLDNL